MHADSGDKKVDIAEVETVSGAPRGELVRQLLSAIARKDVSAGLAAMRTVVEENMDARMLAKLLMFRCRIVLLMRYAPDLAETLGKELSEADMEVAKKLSKELGVNSDTLRALLEAHAQMAYAAVPHLPLELALIDICAAKNSSHA